MSKDDFIMIPIPWVNKQNLFSKDEIFDMHAGIKYEGKLKEYFEETKERLKIQHNYDPVEHTEEELDAGAAVLLTWPFLGKEVLDEETIFAHADIILSILKEENQN